MTVTTKAINLSEKDLKEAKDLVFNLKTYGNELTSESKEVSGLFHDYSDESDKYLDFYDFEVEHNARMLDSTFASQIINDIHSLIGLIIGNKVAGLMDSNDKLISLMSNVDGQIASEMNNVINSAKSFNNSTKAYLLDNQSLVNLGHAVNKLALDIDELI